MRPSLDVGSVLGYAALLLSLLLSSPGVKWVRADEPLVSTAPVTTEGPVCEAQQPIDDHKLAQVLDTLTPQIEAREQAPDPNRPIALNNRGFNYGPEDSEAAIAAIRAQLAAAMEQR